MGEEVDKVKEITESQAQPVENVSKEPTLQDKIDKATDDFISALEDANKPDEKAEEAERQSDKATTDYLSWIDNVIKTVDEKRREAETLNAEQQVADKRIQQFAGIANAAAALINLAGTTKGASPASWTSPTNEFAARAQAAVRHREQVLDKLNNQLLTLQDQRGKVNQAYAASVAKRESTRAAQEAKTKADLAKYKYQSEISKIEAQNKIDVANINAQARQASIDAQNQRNDANLAYKYYKAGQDAAYKDAEAARKKAESDRNASRYGYDPSTGLWYDPETETWSRVRGGPKVSTKPSAADSPYWMGSRNDGAPTNYVEMPQSAEPAQTSAPTQKTEPKKSTQSIFDEL